jgi:phenylacetate-CoA ligase
MFSSKDWGHIDAIRQLQLVQHHVDHIEARIAGPRPLTAAEEIEVTDLLRREFSHSFRLSFEYVDEVERTPSRKFEDFVCRVPEPVPTPIGGA